MECKLICVHSAAHEYVQLLFVCQKPVSVARFHMGNDVRSQQCRLKASPNVTTISRLWHTSLV